MSKIDSLEHDEKVDSLQRQISHNVGGAEIISDARAGSDAQHAMTVKEAFKKYPVAVGFSILYST